MFSDGEVDQEGKQRLSGGEARGLGVVGAVYAWMVGGKVGEFFKTSDDKFIIKVIKKV